MSKILGYEEPFMYHIASGEFSVDRKGRIWKHKDATGRAVDPLRRAEHKARGYLQVRFYVNGKRVSGTASRIVYRAIKGPVPAGHEINHENGIKDDNRPENLFATSPSENLKHAHRNGLLNQYGERNPQAKLANADVSRIRLAYSQGGYTMVSLADRFGVTFQTISDIVRGNARAKDGGPVQHHDLRHSASDRDPNSGRFKKSFSESEY